jgi:alpha-ketoglutarate-dependent 2,4-dichlorophenoxyacetate dioxygenase
MRMAPISARALHPRFAAEINGVDLARPIDPEGLREIIALLGRYVVCVFRRDTPLTDAQHIAFGRLLGPIATSHAVKVTGQSRTRITHQEIVDQSNLDENGEVFRDDDRVWQFRRANRLWHTDISFHPVRATYSLLSAHALPEDGGPSTEFIDMREVHAALPAPMKARIETLVASHSYWHSRVVGGGPTPTVEELKARPPAHHRVVHTHTASGRPSLYLASHASHIVGMPIDEGSALLSELMEFAQQPQFVFAHQWRLGDLVIWDNLATMHRARPFDEKESIRDVRRVSCREREVPG